jgi:hypothetical protein
MHRRDLIALTLMAIASASPALAQSSQGTPQERVPQGCHLEGKPRPLVGMAEAPLQRVSDGRADPGRVAASRCQRVKILTDGRAEGKLRGELAQVAGVGEAGRTD